MKPLLFTHQPLLFCIILWSPLYLAIRAYLSRWQTLYVMYAMLSALVTDGRTSPILKRWRTNVEPMEREASRSKARARPSRQFEFPLHRAQVLRRDNLSLVEARKYDEQVRLNVPQ
jgi:hypothetical protein